MTYGDKIRAMSNRELTKMLMYAGSGCASRILWSTVLGKRGIYNDCHANCEDCIEAKLNMEIE
jgi:hypothetical protein